jgi:hypothetical protein
MKGRDFACKNSKKQGFLKTKSFVKNEQNKHFEF